MKTKLVTSTPELLTALARASPGDRIDLAPGDYAYCKLNLRKYPAQVLVAGADRRRPPVLPGLEIHNCANLTLQDLILAPQMDANGLLVTKSNNIKIKRILSKGASPSAPYSHNNGILLRDSQRVLVEASEVKWHYHALGFLNCDELTIKGNYFHDLQSDGIRGGGTNDLVIVGNHIRNLFPVGADHPDGIQIWTANVKRLTERITIEHNLIERGEGAEAQGIFLRDQLGTGYRGVRIAHNAVVGNCYNALFVQGLTGKTLASGVLAAPTEEVTIEDNLVLGFGPKRGRFRLTRIASGSYARNIFGMLQKEGEVRMTDGGGNVQLPEVKEGDLRALEAFLSNHPATPRPQAALSDAFANKLAKGAAAIAATQAGLSTPGSRRAVLGQLICGIASLAGGGMNS